MHSLMRAAARSPQHAQPPRRSWQQLSQSRRSPAAWRARRRRAVAHARRASASRPAAPGSTSQRCRRPCSALRRRATGLRLYLRRLPLPGGRRLDAGHGLPLRPVGEHLDDAGFHAASRTSRVRRLLPADEQDLRLRRSEPDSGSDRRLRHDVDLRHRLEHVEHGCGDAGPAVPDGVRLRPGEREDLPERRVFGFDAGIGSVQATAWEL